MSQIEPSLLVYGYAFGHMAHAARNRDEQRASAAIATQLVILHDLKLRLGNPKFIFTLSTATNRSKAFHETDQFRSVVKLARRDAAKIALDLTVLFSHMKPAAIYDAVNALDALDVDILDAASGASWREIPPTVRLGIARAATFASAVRSAKIKEGLKRSDRERQPSPPQNRLMANNSRSRRADRFAEQLRPFVMDVLKVLPEGRSLSPSKLAKALNDAGLLSSTGGLWFHNTAMRLLKRLGLWRFTGSPGLPLTAFPDSELSLELQEKLSPP